MVMVEESSASGTELEQLESQALKLCAGERAALAQRLLATL